jgi:hypothetical protein
MNLGPTATSATPEPLAFETMSPLNLITDAYDRQARLYPALLLVAPVVVTIVALFADKLSALQTLGAALLGFGGAFLLTELARDSGKKGEKALFAEWGGVPSVTIFRHRDIRLDAITKARYHNMLNALVNGAFAPTVEQEQTDPAATDTIYSAWSNYLRVNTRDAKRFALLFKENVSYGYRRNVWGLRAAGIAASLISMTVCDVRLYFAYRSTSELDLTLVGAGAFATICLLLWLFQFTNNWVRVPADAYAERLAECVETLGRHDIGR